MLKANIAAAKLHGQAQTLGASEAFEKVNSSTLRVL
jgi:hypothetical protein